REVSVTFRMLARICFELADSFLYLHGEGLCYSDLSLGSFSFDPQTGLVSITDLDIVTIDDGRQTTVLGTLRFIAPEVLRGEAMPTTATDLYSLAVIFFVLLMNSHPLEGAKEARIRVLDESAMMELHGRHPVFIFDPEDDSNRPVPGEHDNALIFWSIYP